MLSIRRLPVGHGAPLRLRVERQLGYRYEMPGSTIEHYQWICPKCRRALLGLAQGQMPTSVAAGQPPRERVEIADLLFALSDDLGFAPHAHREMRRHHRDDGKEQQPETPRRILDKERMRRLIATVQSGRFDPLPLITHRFALDDIVEAYDLFSSRREGVLKVAIRP